MYTHTHQYYVWYRNLRDGFEIIMLSKNSHLDPPNLFPILIVDNIIQENFMKLKRETFK